jgi:hypothetical protein
MGKKLCLVWVSLLLFISSFSQSHEWKLDKDENGIKVYTRPIEGFPVDELRTETVVHAPMAAILAVIMDATIMKNGYLPAASHAWLKKLVMRSSINTR